MKRRSIRTVLVAGDGIVGRSAALALTRALPGVEVSLMAVEEDPAALADRMPCTLPTVHRFHAAIGCDEQDLVRQEIASHHLGTRVDNDWTHSFGQVGRDEGTVPFHQLWLGALKQDRALPFDRYCPASVIAGAGKFVHPVRDPKSPLATFNYGLRLNPRRYHALLVAATASLTCHRAPLAAIDRRSDGGIAAIVLADGQRVAADLYIDCTGPRRRLMGDAASEFDSWSPNLPATEISLRWTSHEGPAPLDQIDRVGDDWRLSTTMPGARLVAEASIAPSTGSARIVPGRLRSSFVANVVAIGDSAVALDPLLGTNRSLAQSAILRLIDLFPGRDCHALELAEYNRLTGLEVDRVRDLHVLFRQRGAVPNVSADLARTLGQWRRRGRLPFFEEDLFTTASWTQILIGTGCLPEAQSPATAVVDHRAAADAMARFADELAALAQHLPNYADYLTTMMRAADQR